MDRLYIGLLAGYVVFAIGGFIAFQIGTLWGFILVAIVTVPLVGYISHWINR